MSRAGGSSSEAIVVSRRAAVPTHVGVNVHVETLVDAQARRDGVLTAIERIRRGVTAGDVVVIFFAGHGAVDPFDGTSYLAPVGAQRDAWMATWLSKDELVRAVRSLPTKTLVFLDACHAAVGPDAVAWRGQGDLTALVRELSEAGNGAMVHAGTTDEQPAQEHKDWGGGAFTTAVVRCLADPNAAQSAGQARGAITVDSLSACISRRVSGTRGTQKRGTAPP